MKREELVSRLDGKYIERKEGETFIRVDKSLAVTVSTFLGIFGASALNFHSLAGNEHATEAWLQVFTKWKEEGLLAE